MTVRNKLYRTGSALGNVRAVTTGRVAQRMVRALRAGGCLMPALVALVLALQSLVKCCDIHRESPA
jgi:hypothetical protein